MLNGVKLGDKVIIRNEVGGLVAVSTVVSETTTTLDVRGFGKFMRSSGKIIGGKLVASCPGPATIEAAEIDLVNRRKEVEQAREEKRQRAYDALPEEVKKARTIRWWFDCGSEKQIAAMPGDLLGRLHEWVKQNPID